jgi:hypothetical protein
MAHRNSRRSRASLVNPNFEIPEDEIWKSFKGNQSGKHYLESRIHIRRP